MPGPASTSGRIWRIADRQTRKKLRVLQLTDLLTPAGGAERLATQIALRLDRDRFEPIVCVGRWNPNALRRSATMALKEELEEAGVRLILLERGSRAAVWEWAPLWSELRRGGIDIVHAHKFGSNVWGTVLGRAARVPVVVAHEHTWSYEGQPVRRFLDRELIARASDAFIAVSREDMRRMIEIERIDADDILFLPNGIPPLEPSTKGGEVRAELGLVPDDPVIGTVAVLRPQKALDILVRATALLHERFPRLTLLVAGAGPEKERLEALSAELGIGDSVRLLGNRTDVPDVLAALDVAVSSSRFEGSPLAIMEYMQAGKAIVATRVGGVPDLIADGVHGLLVDPESPEALAAGIERALADRDRSRAMGERARDRQRAEFDLGTTVERLESLYDELYARKRAASDGRVVAATPAQRARIEPLEGIADARDEWSRLAERSRNVFSTPEWAEAWWRLHGEGKRLALFASRGESGGADAILPLVLERRGPLSLARFLGYGPADELGPVCGPQHREEAASALREVLAGRLGRVDLFLGERMPAEGGWPALLGGSVIQHEESPVLHLEADDWESYLASRSRNFREQVGRRERKLAREHELSYRLAGDPARLDDDLSTLFELHRARWSDARADAFAGKREAFHRDFAARALERGWLRLWFLELDGTPAAAWYGFRFAGADCFYQSGRDPKHESKSVGFVLMAHTIREAIGDGIREYRLLRGGEDYKARFSTEPGGVDTIAVPRDMRGRMALTAARAGARMPPAIRGALVRVAGRP